MELISTADGARLLGVTPRTLYKLIDAHRLHAYRYGRVIRLDLDEVKRYDQGFDGFDDQLGDGEPLVPRPSPLVGAVRLPLPPVGP
jgi:excisionase family DNA binding protein